MPSDEQTPWIWTKFLTYLLAIDFKNDFKSIKGLIYHFFECREVFSAWLCHGREKAYHITFPLWGESIIEQTDELPVI